MSFFRDILNTVQSWRRRRGTARSRPRAGVQVEQMEHRQVLSVTFTGNAVADIPDNGSPGTAIIQNPNRIVPPDPMLANLIKVSGFDISSIRMKYDPAMDILDVAFGQPGNQKTIPEFPVIAGDADNNLNGGTVSPAVTAVQPLFQDYPTLGGSETMAVFLDLDQDSIPDVVAGISNDPGAGKLYQVAEAVPNPLNPSTTAPGFGTPLQDNTGFAFYQDTDPSRGAFEFKIIRFSELYLAQTGQPLKADSVLNVGAFAGSADDFTPELFITASPVSFGVNPISPDCPPLSPPVKINPHQHRHVNTAHPNFVRVTVFGTSGFDVTRIDTDSVRFGGAEPEFFFRLNANRDEFLDVTYVFRGDTLNLPPGKQLASITGLYNDAATGKVVPFESGQIIFVRDSSSYSPADQAAQARRLDQHAAQMGSIPNFVSRRARERNVDLVLADVVTQRTVERQATRPTVKIATRQAAVREQTPAPAIAPRGPAAFRSQQTARIQALAQRRIEQATVAAMAPPTVRIDMAGHSLPKVPTTKRLSLASQWESDLGELASDVALAR